MKAHTATKPMKWIKSESKSTYICPLDVVKGRDKLSEEELKKYCIDESSLPWND